MVRAATVHADDRIAFERTAVLKFDRHAQHVADDCAPQTTENLLSKVRVFTRCSEFYITPLLGTRLPECEMCVLCIRINYPGGAMCL